MSESPTLPRPIPEAQYSSQGARISPVTPPPARARRPRRIVGRPRKVITGILIAIAVLIGGLDALMAYAAMTLPSLDGLGKVTATTRYLDRNGTLIAEFGNGGGAHKTVSLDQVAPVMQQAILAAEDRNFFTEGAVNPGRILKALVADTLLGRPAQGASTITQQLARMAFLPQDKSLTRKLREVLLAERIGQHYSKQQILEMYLNTVYFGHGAYGIEEAAITYFGRHASELSLAEASLLAGLPQAPSADDPFNNPAAAFLRQHYVLDGMVTTRAVTPRDAAAADPLPGIEQNPVPPALLTLGSAHRAATLEDLKHGAPPQQGALVPQFLAYAQQQASELLGTDITVPTAHITITTSIDLNLQAKAQDAVAHGVQSLGRNANNGALLMLDAHSGSILAMVGSANYADPAIAGQFNITTAERRPGSSFKPIVYETGYVNGNLNPNTTLSDTQEQSQLLGGVNDFDGNFQGRMPAWRALVLSRNVPAEQAMTIAGTSNVIDFAHRLGITSALANNASTAIGTSAVRMTDEAAAYAAFANGGTTVKPRAILKISDGGTTLFDSGTAAPGERVMTPQQAWGVTGALRGYDHQWQVGMTRDVAAKSGTTDSFVDAWYMTYTPDWVVATWAGHTDGNNTAEVGMNGVYGTDVGRDIATPFVNGLPPSAGFTAPPGAPTFDTPSGGGGDGGHGKGDHGKGNGDGGGGGD